MLISRTSVRFTWDFQFKYILKRRFLIFHVGRRLFFRFFSNIWGRQLFSDYLSDLFNRRQLDYFLDEKIKNRWKNYVLADVKLDLIHLKNINDVYGHAAGDVAIVNAGKILEMSFKKFDMVWRYGGDEFVVIFERIIREEVDEAIELINQNAQILNAKEKLSFLISFSIGYDIFDNGSGWLHTSFLSISMT